MKEVKDKAKIAVIGDASQGHKVAFDVIAENSHQDYKIVDEPVSDINNDVGVMSAYLAAIRKTNPNIFKFEIDKPKKRTLLNSQQKKKRKKKRKASKKSKRNNR